MPQNMSTLCDWRIICAKAKLSGDERRRREGFQNGSFPRLRVVSNFGDTGEIHVRARRWAPARRRPTRRGADFRARACISPESPKLETTRSLLLPNYCSAAKTLPREQSVSDTLHVQFTPNNSNLQGKSKKVRVIGGSSYRG